MRKVVLYMTTTLDGFIAGPGNELDWMTGAPDQALNDDVVALLQQSDAGFLGYPVAQGMIPYWEGVAADTSASQASRDFAAAVNRLHRVVISNQPVDVPWDNAELVVARDDDDLVAAVTEFKRQPGSDLGVPGGVRTAQRFARLGLIDEYVLQVHPIAIGAGKPLFTQQAELQLISAKTYYSGVIRLRYKTHRDPPSAAHESGRQ
ncbi:MAG TPA: dihydrofolate reductase family protein [Streptosporangiaceae bacterium]